MVAGIQLTMLLPTTHYQKAVLKVLDSTVIITCIKHTRLPIYLILAIDIAINQSLNCSWQNCLIIKRESAGRFLNLICWGRTEVLNVTHYDDELLLSK